jgi:hypothetical protein
MLSSMGMKQSAWTDLVASLMGLLFFSSRSLNGFHLSFSRSGGWCSFLSGAKNSSFLIRKGKSATGCHAEIRMT